ncbi:hypothetical protein ABWH92_06365 [Ahrensia marina]|uniref:hypothetical protein n=1 Tax=Ahrensia marina TaxID=1514904 RepID=UPI0035D0A54C
MQKLNKKLVGVLCLGSSLLASAANAEPSFYAYGTNGLEMRADIRLVSPSRTVEILKERSFGAPYRLVGSGPHLPRAFSVVQPMADDAAVRALLDEAILTLTEEPPAGGAELQIYFERQRHAQDVIQALGGPEEEAFLVGLATDITSWSSSAYYLVPAVGSALRRDALQTSEVLTVWGSQTGTEVFQAALTMALAMWGYAPAQERLVELIAVERRSDLFTYPVLADAFDIITTREHPAVTSLVRDYLQAQSPWRQVGSQPASPQSVVGLSGNEMISAVLYGHAYFAGEDRLLLDGPVAQLTKSQALRELLPFLADPRDGARALFAISKGWNAGQDSYRPNPFVLMPDLCHLRLAAERSGDADAWQDIERLFWAWGPEAFGITHLLDRVQTVLLDWTVGFAAFNCDPSGRHLAQVDNTAEDPFNILPDFARAASPDQWRLSGHHTSDDLDFSFTVLDQLNEEALSSLVEDRAVADHPLWYLAQMRHGVLSAAHFGHLDVYQGQDDRRFFVAQNSEGSTPVYAGGIAELRVRQNPSGTLFGLRLSADYYIPEDAAFGASIARLFDDIDASLADGALSMIQSVTLRHGSSSTPLTRQRSAPDGTHVYVLDEEIDDMDNLVVDVEIASLRQGTAFLSFPLYASSFGYQSLFEDGAIEVHVWQ